VSGAEAPAPEPHPPTPDPADLSAEWVEFEDRRAGVIHAMEGGLWLHRHLWRGTHRLAHLVSTDRTRLLAWGARVGLPVARLQYHALRDPRDGVRRPAWHWDLGGPFLPPAR
jgi:hypothetical protein